MPLQPSPQIITLQINQPTLTSCRSDCVYESLVVGAYVQRAPGPGTTVRALGVYYVFVVGGR